MAYGLQIWDSSGNVRLDTSDRECRYVGFFTGSVSSSSSVAVTVSGMATDGTWGLNELAYSNFTFLFLWVLVSLLFQMPINITAMIIKCRYLEYELRH